MKIIITNLGLNVTDESIRATFATYGEVQSSRVMFDPASGNTGKIALIEMPDEIEKAHAIKKLDGCIMDTCRIKVSIDLN